MPQVSFGENVVIAAERKKTGIMLQQVFLCTAPYH